MTIPYAAYQALRDAIDTGNIEEFNRLISENPHLNINGISPSGLSALWWACIPMDKKLKPEMIKRIIYILFFIIK